MMPTAAQYSNCSQRDYRMTSSKKFSPLRLPKLILNSKKKLSTPPGQKSLSTTYSKRVTQTEEQEDLIKESSTHSRVQTISQDLVRSLTKEETKGTREDSCSNADQDSIKDLPKPSIIPPTHPAG